MEFTNILYRFLHLKIPQGDGIVTEDDKGTYIQVNEKFTAYIGQALSLLCPQITVPEF